LKITTATLFFLLSFSKSFSQDNKQNFVTYDIDNFWTAYDKISTTKDSIQQYHYLNKLFIEIGSPGLKAIMQARGYTAKSYIDAINNYPLFWNSIRENTLKAKGFAKDIEIEINKVKNSYPGLKPAGIFFTIGAFRTGGTTLNGMVLIGSEIAMADKNVITKEFPGTFGHLKPFFETDPIKNVVFGNVHEYIHTQQKTTIGDNLLAQSVLEGVAEFVTVTATGKRSVAPAISYGKENTERVREVFTTHMFNSFTGYWLYSNAENEFKVRDLGYYVGYAICESYYEKAIDKKQAIKEMIELEYNNEIELQKFTDKSGYFAKPVIKLKEQFEKNRPVVTKITQFKNGDKKVSPTLTRITIEFSTKMDKQYRNFELGTLGEANLLGLKKMIGFSEDEQMLTFEIELKANRQYQIVVGSGFRSKDGISLKPYSINFTTADK
jgi:hypothetical protein